jgi:hypothetical protein
MVDHLPYLNQDVTDLNAPSRAVPLNLLQRREGVPTPVVTYQTQRYLRSLLTGGDLGGLMRILWIKIPTPAYSFTTTRNG